MSTIHAPEVTAESRLKVHSTALHRRRWGFAVAALIAAAWGLLAGLWTPRGPLTTSEALWSLVISLAIGALAGLAARSRWTMLLAPLVFLVVFETVRIGTDGPTVDEIGTSTYAVFAFVVGRGFHAVLALLPLLLGAAVGAGVARRRSGRDGSGRRVTRYSRRAVAIVTALVLVALGAGLARSAATDPITDATGAQVAGSVAELSSVTVDGRDLGLMIRGHSTDNPVLLFLAGGPGGSDLGAMRNHLPELEEHFTVATWDQRGAGKSYPELDPTRTISPQGYVDDTIAVTDYLRSRFDQDTIYLLGQSWGTILGVLAVQQHPELYSAYIGTGQMVSPVATDRIFYQDTLDWAKTGGDDALVDTLTAIGPPPYAEMLDYESALAYEHQVYPYDHSGNSEGAGGFSENFFVAEYALIDQIHILGAFMDTFAVLYPQVQDVDFRDSATAFEVPVYFVQGAHEAGGRAEPFADWYPMITAPAKDLTVLDTSGHRPLFEQPDAFVAYLINTVLTQTTEASAPRRARERSS